MDLQELKTKIESLPEENQTNIFCNIISPNSIEYMHNTNGVFLDLRSLDEETLQQLEIYVNIFLSRQSSERLENSLPSEVSLDDYKVPVKTVSKKKCLGKTKMAEISIFQNSVQETSQKSQKRGSRMRFLVAAKRFCKKGTPDIATDVAEELCVLQKEHPKIAKSE